MLGRAAVLRHAAKFLLTDGLGRLRLTCCQAEGGPLRSCSTRSKVDRPQKRPCCFGPSPRTLFQDLRLDSPLADNPLEWWRGLVQEAEFDHELYAAQRMSGGNFRVEEAVSW